MFKIDQFDTLEKRYRGNFINSLSGYKSANLIGTINEQGKENLALFSSAFHLGADPALIGIISRPDSVPRDTLENILNTKFYSINHVNKDIIKNAHQTSARTDVSEFELARLTSIYHKGFKAPFLKEAKIQLATELVETIRITHNNTVLIIGAIRAVFLESEDYIASDGTVDLIKAEGVWVNGLNTYGIGHKSTKLSYAKEDKWPEEI